MDLRNRGQELLQGGLQVPRAEFREDQWEAISTLVEARGRILVVQRTGWGKSAVYFVAARLGREQGKGPAIIISPLLALMRNQTQAAAKFGVRLGTINSSNSREENTEAEKALLADELDAVIISPERLANEAFMEAVLRPVADHIGLFVIDEAHCISDWGHDFRPDYKRIVGVLGFLPEGIPVLATTATANERVMQDVAAQLGGLPRVLRGPLMRDSLHLQTIIFPRRSQRLAWLAQVLPTIEGTGIIYVATTRDAELVARYLREQRGLKVEAYYGSLQGLSNDENREERRRREQALLDNEVKALVATSALGMGFDKPDLAFVIHFQSPGSVVSYYQQVGRAGRGIPKAYGVLLSGGEDDDIQQFFIRNSFPTEALVTEILDTLDASEDGLKLREIEQRVNGGKKKIQAAIRFLAAESPAPIIRSGSVYRRTLLDYQLPHESIQRILSIKQQEWRDLQDYVEHDGCLMLYLAGQLDDPSSKPCGRCGNCLGTPELPTEYSQDLGLEATDFMERTEIEILPKRRTAPALDEVLQRWPIDQFEFRFGDLEHEVGRALSRWGEAGWGEIAMQSKRWGRLDEPLVSASVRLIRERWGPEPAPTWLTWVPSLAHPELVPVFARRLAEELGLPAVGAVRKIRQNQPQKEMENAFHRCQNLDGVFGVEEDLVQEGPVLLVDDAFDSGWTFAVVAALLRRAASGPVFPFAVMDTSTSS